MEGFEKDLLARIVSQDRSCLVEDLDTAVSKLEKDLRHAGGFVGAEISSAVSTVSDFHWRPSNQPHSVEGSERLPLLALASLPFDDRIPHGLVGGRLEPCH